MSLAETLVRRNALLGRYAFSQLRPMACAISVGIYFTMAGIIVILCFADHYERNHLNVQEFWRITFMVFAVVQLFMLWILGMYQTGSALQQEIAEKSMDFFRLLPLAAPQKILGILIGRNLVALGLAVVNTLILVVCGLAAHISGGLLAGFLAFSWVASGTAMLLALLSATYERRGRATSGPAAILVLSVFLLPYAIGIAASWKNVFPKGAFIDFFGWRVPLFAFLIALALYAATWFVLGLIRRFDNERAPLLTPGGAAGCLTGTEVIALGLGWRYFPGGVPAAVTFWVGTGCVTVIMVLGALRNWDEYLEAAGRTGAKPGVNVTNPSNLVLGTALVLLWGLFAGGVSRLAGAGVPCTAVPVLLTCGLFFVTLIEFSVTHAPLTPRVYLLSGFLAGLYCVLPMIVAAVMDSSVPMLFSPIGYVAELCNRSAVSAESAWVNLLLVLLLGLFIRRRYSAILPPST